jgi:hypothetical protein|tara:strand:- start:44 stop:277 length:234 start_codon:yes stop_codon:yes gene_type:complete
MENIFNKIEVTSDHKHFQIRELKDDGGWHRRLLLCGESLAEDEHQEVKDKAEAEWTDEVKTAWTTYQAEQKALNNLE